MSLLPMLGQADTIWKCQDLQQVPEFSTIQCAADAMIYVPSRPNAGNAFGSSPEDNRRYLEFITEHNARMQGQGPKKKQNTEGHNLNRFKSYSSPRR